MPMIEAIRGHVFAAARTHAHEMTVPVLASGKTRTGRLWTYVCDYAHPVIMRSSQEQEPISIGFSDDFRLTNCA
jgi:hypothetical protein